jgi:transcriptional activator Myb
VRSIIKPTLRPASWSEEETAILSSIMKYPLFYLSEDKPKNRWNYIARELFVRSGKRFFRNPKQCRERWMNHLDPKKVHSEWTAMEDLVMLTTIKKKGKRWSLAVKELNHTRTEHMVKNRYKSLISN